MIYDLTPIAVAIVAFFAAIVSVFLIPFVKNKVGEQNMQSLFKWVEIAVKAAEQLYTSDDGEKKKEYVLNFLANEGFAIDEAEVNNSIEAAVLDIHNKLYGTEKIYKSKGE